MHHSVRVNIFHNSNMSSDNVYLDINCIKCPVCYKIFTNPFIVNCRSKCIICEYCLVNIFQFQTTSLQNERKDKEVEEMEKCVCNTMANRRQCKPAVGIDRIIKNVK